MSCSGSLLALLIGYDAFLEQGQRGRREIFEVYRLEGNSWERCKLSGLQPRVLCMMSPLVAFGRRVYIFGGIPGPTPGRGDLIHILEVAPGGASGRWLPSAPIADEPVEQPGTAEWTTGVALPLSF